MVALRKSAQQAGSLPAKREIRREQCRDDDGNSYTVIVWRRPGHISTTYTLEDGTPVHYEDERVFALPQRQNDRPVPGVSTKKDRVAGAPASSW